MEKYQILTQVPFFSHLKDNKIAELSEKAQILKYSRGEWIVYQGDLWPHLFLVTDGEIQAIKESVEGRSLIATTIRPGEIFWGLAFFIEGAPMPVLLQAKTNVGILLWDRDTLVPLIRENGDMAWDLCNIMINRMQLASEIVEDLAFLPVISRLAGLLLDISKNPDDEYVAREFTLDEMAARIGTTREVVCRYLYRFAAIGAIDINRTEFKIIDRDFLRSQTN